MQFIRRPLQNKSILAAVLFGILKTLFREIQKRRMQKTLIILIMILHQNMIFRNKKYLLPARKVFIFTENAHIFIIKKQCTE